MHINVIDDFTKPIPDAAHLKMYVVYAYKEALQELFLDCVRCHFSQYPGMLSGCNINWMCDWPQESLLGEASYFITKNQLTEEFEDLR